MHQGDQQPDSFEEKRLNPVFIKSGHSPGSDQVNDDLIIEALGGHTDILHVRFEGWVGIVHCLQDALQEMQSYLRKHTVSRV